MSKRLPGKRCRRISQNLLPKRYPQGFGGTELTFQALVCG